MLWLAAATAGFAQNARPAGEALTGLRPVSAREGKEIALATARPKSVAERQADCSHLVHGVYEQAGYPYPYADSLDLYNGSESFVRVRAAQPGDLIVWRGHVGIVLEPKKHSFYSSTRSGARIDFYDSAYWRTRGPARFYRYLTDRPAKGRGAAPEIESGALASAALERGNRRAEHRPSIQPAKTTRPVRTLPAAVSEAHSEVEPASVTRAEIAPETVLHVSGKRQPRPADVAQAIVETNQAAGEILRTGNLEQLGRTVIIYRGLQVTGVEIKGKRGAAQVEIESLAVLSGGRMEAQRGWEALRPELQRKKKGWAMTAANANVYVPRDAALRVLAARLGTLTQEADPDAARDREQAQIIRLLNLLVVEN